MDNIFESKKEELESAYSAFSEFYSKMDEYFRSKEVSSDELQLIKAIHYIVEELDKGKKGKDGKLMGYGSWTGDDLTRADNRLANYLLTLGELANQKVQKANTMGRWLKWRKHNEWNPAKQVLEKQLESLEKDKQKRILKDDIEAEVSKKLFADSVIEAMMAGHADLLLTMFDATKSVLTALAHRINLKKDERQLVRK